MHSLLILLKLFYPREKLEVRQRSRSIARPFGYGVETVVQTNLFEKISVICIRMTDLALYAYLRLPLQYIEARHSWSLAWENSIYKGP